MIAWPLLCLFLAASLTAGEPASTGVQPDLIDAWLARQATVRSWKADFVQTRTLPTLTDPLTARGRLWFAAPDKFRWELGQPAQTIAVRQPAQMLVIYPELKRAERYPLGNAKNRPWQGALALLEAGFPKDRATLEAQFRFLSARQSDDSVTVVLQPKSPSARRLIPRIQVTLSAADFALRATQLEFPDGSTMRNDFANAELNPALNPELFNPELGPGYTIVEPLKNEPPRRP